jgi:hypothetical protein
MMPELRFLEMDVFALDLSEPEYLFAILNQTITLPKLGMLKSTMLTSQMGSFASSVLKHSRTIIRLIITIMTDQLEIISSLQQSAVSIQSTLL